MNVKDLVYEKCGFSINYKIFFNDNANGDLPLIVYLHGAGERGNNAEHLYRHGIPKLIKEGKNIDAVVLAPQCPALNVWDNIVDKVKDIIDTVAAEFKIKKDRICITGSSMGGFGTWMMGLTYPSCFAAIAPVAGGGMSWRSAKLAKTPILAAHGSADDVVPFEYSRLMTDAVNANGGSARLIKLDGLGHNDGIDFAYRNTEIIEWLIGQRRNNFDYVPEICEEFF